MRAALAWIVVRSVWETFPIVLLFWFRLARSSLLVQIGSNLVGSNTSGDHERTSLPGSGVFFVARSTLSGMAARGPSPCGRSWLALQACLRFNFFWDLKELSRGRGALGAVHMPARAC